MRKGALNVTLRVVVCVPCDVFVDTSFRPTFLAVATPGNDPRVSCLLFSEDGALAPRSSTTIPISCRLQLSVVYPFLWVFDGSRRVCFRFKRASDISSIVSVVFARNRETLLNKLSLEKVYESFFTPQIALDRVAALPAASGQNMFQTKFRLDRGSIDRDPTAIAMLMQSERKFRNYTDMTLFVSTWNIDQKLPPADLAELIEAPNKQYDLYVFNCQEIDMTAECIFRGKSPAKAEQWDTALLQAVSQNESYTKIASRQLGTCYMAAFVKAKMADRVTEVATGSISYGKMGFYNKTSVGVRMAIDDSQFCFICSHLSHGNKNVERRNYEFWKIQDELTFETADGEVHVLDHDAVIWCGDFNYRLTIPDPESRRRFKEREYLLKHDQLIDAHKNKKAFVGYEEGTITFTPTYKYDRGKMEIDTSSKQRGPAWCDRVMFRTQGSDTLLKLKEYDARHSLMMSDHHPVYAIFDIKPWTTNVAIAQKMYEETQVRMKSLLWSAKLLADSVDFGDVRFGVQKTKTVALRNDGQVPVLFSFQKPPVWLKIEPMQGQVAQNQTIEIAISVLIDQRTQKVEPVISRVLFGKLELVFPEERPRMSICVTGNYIISPVGMPLSFLMRLDRPLGEVNAEFLEPTTPDNVNSAPICQLQSCVDVPSEIFMLVDELLKTGQDRQLFLKTGKSEEVMGIFEDLRVRRNLQGRYDCHSVAEALLTFLDCLYEPLIPEPICKEWAKRPVQLSVIFKNLPAENVKTLNYITQFVNHLFDTLWADVQENIEGKIIDVFGPVFTGRGTKENDYQSVSIPIAAALIKAWSQTEVID